MARASQASLEEHTMALQAQMAGLLDEMRRMHAGGADHHPPDGVPPHGSIAVSPPFASPHQGGTLGHASAMPPPSAPSPGSWNQMKVRHVLIWHGLPNMARGTR
eukprot:5850134-Prymnesium_polylepis.1